MSAENMDTISETETKELIEALSVQEVRICNLSNTVLELRRHIDFIKNNSVNHGNLSKFKHDINQRMAVVNKMCKVISGNNNDLDELKKEYIDLYNKQCNDVKIITRYIHQVMLITLAGSFILERIMDLF